MFAAVPNPNLLSEETASLKELAKAIIEWKRCMSPHFNVPHITSSSPHSSVISRAQRIKRRSWEQGREGGERGPRNPRQSGEKGRHGRQGEQGGQRGQGGQSGQNQVRDIAQENRLLGSNGGSACNDNNTSQYNSSIQGRIYPQKLKED